MEEEGGKGVVYNHSVNELPERKVRKFARVVGSKNLAKNKCLATAVGLMHRTVVFFYFKVCTIGLCVNLNGQCG